MSLDAPYKAGPDWTSAATDVLLNPRMSAPQQAALLAAQARMPSLDGHVWLTTSGSSGIKWVALSKSAILASAQAVNVHVEASSDDVWTLALPTFHVGGLGVLARGFLSGAPVFRYADDEGNPRWDAAAFHAFLLQTRTTLTTLVPTQLHDLVRAGFASPSGLRAAVIGGGALNPTLYRAARALGWPILPSYGLSECCSQVATAPLASLKSEQEQDDTPLILLSHVEARIGDDKRIVIRSPSLLTGYGLLDADGVGRFVDPKENGWFLTEDRGNLKQDALSVLGRIGDFVKIGGESVDVARLNLIWTQAQSSERAMPETVLFAAPDARLGAAIHLAVVGEPAQREQVERSVQSFNLSVLPFERVQHLHWLEEIPRSPLGKLLRTELLKRTGCQTD